MLAPPDQRVVCPRVWLEESEQAQTYRAALLLRVLLLQPKRLERALTRRCLRQDRLN